MQHSTLSPTLNLGSTSGGLIRGWSIPSSSPPPMKPPPIVKPPTLRFGPKVSSNSWNLPSASASRLHSSMRSLRSIVLAPFASPFLGIFRGFLPRIARRSFFSGMDPRPATASSTVFCKSAMNRSSAAVADGSAEMDSLYAPMTASWCSAPRLPAASAALMASVAALSLNAAEVGADVRT